MMAEVQGEIMSFTSVLGLTMVSVRTDELMLLPPCLVMMMKVLVLVLVLSMPGL